MTKVFDVKMDWKHIVIAILLLTLVYFIWKHNGIKNVNDYVNTQYGPFIGRSYYFEISSQLFKKDM